MQNIAYIITVTLQMYNVQIFV